MSDTELLTEDEHAVMGPSFRRGSTRRCPMAAEQQFPAPYLQPMGSQDCGFYAAAYIARCLGHPDVTADQVKAWRADTGQHEGMFVERALGHEQRRWWEDKDDEPARRRWWLGPGGQDWVRGWLTDGWIGHAVVHRIPTLAHAVVLLDATDDGVLLMDPWPAGGGHVVEPWDWFLGFGAGVHGCHRIDGWYRRPVDVLDAAGNHWPTRQATA